MFIKKQFHQVPNFIDHLNNWENDIGAIKRTGGFIILIKREYVSLLIMVYLPFLPRLYWDKSRGLHGLLMDFYDTINNRTIFHYFNCDLSMNNLSDYKVIQIVQIYLCNKYSWHRSREEDVLLPKRSGEGHVMWFSAFTYSFRELWELLQGLTIVIVISLQYTKCVLQCTNIISS